MRLIETMRLDVERRMKRGERFIDVEDVINASDLSADEKSALWLLGGAMSTPERSDAKPTPTSPGSRPPRRRRRSAPVDISASPADSAFATTTDRHLARATPGRPVGMQRTGRLSGATTLPSVALAALTELKGRTPWLHPPRRAGPRGPKGRDGGRACPAIRPGSAPRSTRSLSSGSGRGVPGRTTKAR
jgi:hypothetical protein